MSGSGVEMMKRFVEAHKLGNSSSPAIFNEVYNLLHIKINRLKKIEEMYAETNEKAPLTACPHCGSKIILTTSCEFCGHYLMEDVIATDENGVEIETEVVIPEPVVEKVSRRTVAKEVVAEVKEVEATPEVKPVKEAKVEVKADLTEEEINKLRRPGIKRIVEEMGLKIKLDVDKDDVKDIKAELLALLLGTTKEAKVEAKEAKAEVKATVKEKAIDLSGIPKKEELDEMSEDSLIELIDKYSLNIPEIRKELEGDFESDDDFFACVDAVGEALEKLVKEAKAPKAKEEVKVSRRAKTEVKEDKPVKGVLIDISDLPEAKDLEEKSEKELAEVITRFGLDLAKEKKMLDGGKLGDDDFFACVDAIDAKLEEIANKINDGKEPTYPVVTEVKKEVKREKRELSKPDTSKIEVEEDYADIDLDDVEVEFSDIDIDDVD